VEELVRAITAVHGGRHHVGPRLRAVAAVTHDGEAEGVSTPLAGLTEREVEMLISLAEGASTKAVAGGLGVSSKTVDAHRRSLYRKLGLTTLQELTWFACEHGLISRAQPREGEGGGTRGGHP
jgi:DNA-binding NarL/FixJ family response regulator